jgi:hypothetical protein
VLAPSVLCHDEAEKGPAEWPPAMKSEGSYEAVGLERGRKGKDVSNVDSDVVGEVAYSSNNICADIGGRGYAHRANTSEGDCMRKTVEGCATVPEGLGETMRQSIERLREKANQICGLLLEGKLITLK